MSDTSANVAAASGHRPMGFPEFVVVIASIMALNPLAMDMMLPALPNIRAAFALADANGDKILGFQTGDELVRALQSAEPRAKKLAIRRGRFSTTVLTKARARGNRTHRADVSRT